MFFYVCADFLLLALNMPPSEFEVDTFYVFDNRPPWRILLPVGKDQQRGSQDKDSKKSQQSTCETSKRQHGESGRWENKLGAAAVKWFNTVCFITLITYHGLTISICNID